MSESKEILSSIFWGILAVILIVGEVALWVTMVIMSICLGFLFKGALSDKG